MRNLYTPENDESDTVEVDGKIRRVSPHSSSTSSSSTLPPHASFEDDFDDPTLHMEVDAPNSPDVFRHDMNMTTIDLDLDDPLTAHHHSTIRGTNSGRDCHNNYRNGEITNDKKLSTTSTSTRNRVSSATELRMTKGKTAKSSRASSTSSGSRKGSSSSLPFANPYNLRSSSKLSKNTMIDSPLHLDPVT